MMYAANYTPMIVVWIVIIQTALSMYHAKTSLVGYGAVSVKQRMGYSIQCILFLVLISKYVELYALTLNHPNILEAQDWQMLPAIISVYVIIQAAVLMKKPTRIGASLMAIGILNVGVLSYFAMIKS